MNVTQKDYPYFASFFALLSQLTWYQTQGPLLPWQRRERYLNSFHDLHNSVAKYQSEFDDGIRPTIRQVNQFSYI